MLVAREEGIEFSLFLYILSLRRVPYAVNLCAPGGQMNEHIIGSCARTEKYHLITACGTAQT